MTQEQRFKLTELGEHEAVRLYGGQDIVNMASFLALVLETRGGALGEHPPQDFGTFSLLSSVALAFRVLLGEGDAWRQAVVLAERTLEQKKPDYFKTMPHAFTGDSL